MALIKALNRRSTGRKKKCKSSGPRAPSLRGGVTALVFRGGETKGERRRERRGRNEEEGRRVNRKVALEFLQAAVKFKPVFLVNRDFHISLDRS